jgi:Ser/Thr protein kinase RdoA (MazF antagonist)
VAQELLAFWRSRREVIDELVGRADAEGRQLSTLPCRQVLCRADLHTWNVLVDAEHQLWSVD